MIAQSITLYIPIYIYNIQYSSNNFFCKYQKTFDWVIYIWIYIFYFEQLFLLHIIAQSVIFEKQKKIAIQS